MGMFATGVAVIVTAVDDQIHSMTANAVSSVSLDPMLVLFCPSKKSGMSQYLESARRFTINFLREDQQALASYFAGVWRDLEAPPFRFVAASDSQRLEGALAALVCEKHQIVDGGDHWIVIGRVLDFHQGIEPHRPLLFYKGRYRAIDTVVSTPAPDLAALENEPAHIFYDPAATPEY
jgi:3-hydroxy-9,10-secoandrosta-1,3,5(10)-triene-9,17-dione monooxygenase reductase component